MDLWGVGCVFFEELTSYPLFPGKNEVDQIHKIHNILGTPPKELLNKFQKYSIKLNYNYCTLINSYIKKRKRKYNL